MERVVSFWDGRARSGCDPMAKCSLESDHYDLHTERCCPAGRSFDRNSVAGCEWFSESILQCKI